MIKRFFCALLLLSSLILLGCSNTPSQIISYSEADTLRNLLQTKESSITWTNTIEENILSENISAFDNFSSSIKLSPDVICACVPPTDSKSLIYPSIEGFSSLDTTELQSLVRQNIEKIISALNEDPYSINEDLFQKEYLFNYILFLYDLKNLLAINYNEDFPLELDEPTDEPENNQTNTSNTKKLFSNHIFGQPFIGESIIQVPVRLYLPKKGFIDLSFYVLNDKYKKITQIDIINWEVIYGK